jgi:DNA-binding response OmpR family regulator
MPNPKRILIFEDNPSIRTLLKLFCEKRGLEPLVFEDAVDAVALTVEHDPALILMDIIMPGKDGVQATRDLRRAGVAAPIIVLTSKHYEEDRVRALEAGATGFMLKPFNPAKLDELIRPLLPS